MSWPPEGEPEFHGLCFLIMRRSGGLLLALPNGFLGADVLQGAAAGGGEGLVGPHTVMSVPGVVFDGDEMHGLGTELDVLVVDMAEPVLGALVPFANVQVEEDIILGFSEDLGHLPDPARLLTFTKEWVSMNAAEQIAFYSAEDAPAPSGPPEPKQKAKAKATEKAKRPAALAAEHIASLAKMMPMVVDQLGAIQEEQRRMQEFMYGQSMAVPPRPTQTPVSMPLQSFAKMMGSPPRTKQMNLMAPPPRMPAHPGEDGEVEEHAGEMMGSLPSPEGGNVLAQAVLQQSKALTSLVEHLQHGGDPLLESQGPLSSMSSRGAANREKLQKELANRSGSFFLQVMQNAFKRMKPATPLPGSLADIAASDFSMIQYLERCGGYGNAKEAGLIMYALGFVADAAMKQDMEGVQEHLALLLVAIEQSVQDQNRWDLAFQLTLLEDPPQAMFSYKNNAVQSTGRTKAFAPLCPQRWATVALAFGNSLQEIRCSSKKGRSAWCSVGHDFGSDPKAQTVPKSKGGCSEGGGSTRVTLLPFSGSHKKPASGSGESLPRSSSSSQPSASAVCGRVKPLPDEAETTQTSKASSFDVEGGDGPGNFNAQDGLCSRSFGGCDFKSIPFVSWPWHVLRNILKSRTR